MDVIKILAQVGAEGSHGFFSSFANLYNKEGMKAFWKGNGIACLRLFPFNAIEFVAFSKMKNYFVDSDGHMSPLKSLVAGSLAGVVATVLTYPTDMVKTRLTIDHSDPSKAKYKGVVDCFVKVYKEEGFKALFKGMGTSIAGVIPFAGGTFMAYEFLGKWRGKSGDKRSAWETFVDGCLAGAFAQTFSYPFDTIRKKLQAQMKSGKTPQYAGMLDCFAKTIKKDGVLGLWKGTVANLAKVAPYAGITFAAHQACTRMLTWYNGYTVSPWSSKPIPGVPQNLKPHELREWLAKPKPVAPVAQKGVEKKK